MILSSLNILNYRNIREASLEFSPKLNCFVGLNGQGKTNVLDAIYLLSFAKSSFTNQDSLNITLGEEMALVQGIYKMSNDKCQMSNDDSLTISCGIKRGAKKQFRRDKKDYSRLIDHIGLIPLVMISPADQELIAEGSDERRRFMDVVICQQDRKYLDCLTSYNALLKQRNALLKKLGEAHSEANLPPAGGTEGGFDFLEVLEWQMVEPAEYIYQARTKFAEGFVPLFQQVYLQISGIPSLPFRAEDCQWPSESRRPGVGSPEVPVLRYISQLQDRDLREAYVRTRQRDLILGWTSQGIHKDDLDMRLGDYPLKQVGSQGQQRTFVLAMKLAQALYLSKMSNVQSQMSNATKPILLLDDIFDRLDSERVERIVELVQSDDFGQIFITDTDRQHLTEILKPNENAKIFHVEGGKIES